MERNFDFTTAKRGTEITEEIYDDFLNCMPPISLRGGQDCDCGFQMSEPYCHRTDTRTGQFRALFPTFVKRGGRCYYEGHNFAGEVNSRPYMIAGTWSDE